MSLEKEIICGYEVSSKMKRLWAMELDIMKRFVEVCTQFGLRYWIAYGTLIGAVRHKGFIPWDNDMDVLMPRKDFDKLLEIGPRAFEKPFFFQTPITESSRFFCTFVKIRDERGTAGVKDDYDSGLNCGVFIDVFCLDEIPDGFLKRKFYYRKLNELAKMQRFCLNKTFSKGFVNSIKHGLQKMVFKYVYKSPDAGRLFMIYQKAAGRYAGTGTREVEDLSFGHYENLKWNRHDWEGIVQLGFEDQKFIAPRCYDSVLKKVYGDYMQIPEDKTTHDYLEFDPDIPYVDFFK